MWYAVDKKGRKFLFEVKPQRHFDCCWYDAVKLDRRNIFRIQVEVTGKDFITETLPPLTWKDEPVEVFITTKEDEKI